MMGANGGSTGRRWPRATRAPAHTTAAPWPPAAPSASRYAVLLNDGSIEPEVGHVVDHACA